MAVRLPPPFRFRVFSNLGLPGVGYKLWSYAAGTSTPKATYTDAGGGTANTNPVIMDAAGYADVWLTEGEGYKFRLDTNLDVTVWTVDNVLLPVLSGVGLPTGISMAVTEGTFTASNGVSTLTLPGFLQVNKLYLGVEVVVDQTFGNGNGLVTLMLGTPDLADRWGSGIGRTATSNNGARRNSIYAPQSATDLILTAEGGLFSTTGIATATRYELTLG